MAKGTTLRQRYHLVAWQVMLGGDEGESDMGKGAGVSGSFPPQREKRQSFSLTGGARVQINLHCGKCVVSSSA